MANVPLIQNKIQAFEDIKADTGLFINNSEQYVSMTAGYKNGVSLNTWYPALALGTSQYALTAFLIFVGYENNVGDAANTSAMFMSPGSSAYNGSNAALIRIGGSTSLEARVPTTSPYQIEVRTTSIGNGGGTSSQVLRWWIMRIPGN